MTLIHLAPEDRGSRRSERSVVECLSPYRLEGKWRGETRGDERGMTSIVAHLLRHEGSGNDTLKEMRGECVYIALFTLN